MQHVAERGWETRGVDNNMREAFFGAGGSTRAVVHHLEATLKNYQHSWLDIRDR